LLGKFDFRIPKKTGENRKKIEKTEKKCPA